MRLALTEPVIALLIFLFPLAYSPGPGNMFFAAIGARFGLRASMAANAGYHAATWIVTFAIGLGFSAAMHSLPQLFTVIKWIGSAYVLYLALRFIRSGAATGSAQAGPAGFADGAMLLVLNPKAYLIIGLMFSQFLIGSGFDRMAAVLWISTIFTLNNLLAFILWTAFGDRLASRFRDEAGARMLNHLFGLLLAGVAVWMLLG